MIVGTSAVTGHSKWQGIFPSILAAEQRPIPIADIGSPPDPCANSWLLRELPCLSLRRIIGYCDMGLCTSAKDSTSVTVGVEFRHALGSSAECIMFGFNDCL